MPPDTSQMRHSLPLQACLGWLTLKATPARLAQPSGPIYIGTYLLLPTTVPIPMSVANRKRGQNVIFGIIEVPIFFSYVLRY